MLLPTTLASVVSSLAAQYLPILRPTRRPPFALLQPPATPAPLPSQFHPSPPPLQLASGWRARRCSAQRFLPRNPSTHIPFSFRRHRTPARIPHKKHT